MLCEDAQVTASLVSAVLVGRRAELAALTAALRRAPRAIVDRVLSGAPAGDIERYVWPVVWMGARIEAERGLAARDARQAVPLDAEQRADALKARAGRMPTRWAGGYLALIEAEDARLHRLDEVAAWTTAVEAAALAHRRGFARRIDA
jgi:hypothetical protein